MDRIAAVNLDLPRVELPSLTLPTRLHGSTGIDAGLASPSRLAATRPAIHALTSVASHPTAFVDNRIGGGKLPAAISRYSDDRLSPVVRWTSRRRMIRSRPGSNVLDGACCLLRLRATRPRMGPAEQPTGKSDLDGFILAVLSPAGIRGDSHGIVRTQSWRAKGRVDLCSMFSVEARREFPSPLCFVGNSSSLQVVQCSMQAMNHFVLAHRIARHHERIGPLSS